MFLNADQGDPSSELSSNRSVRRDDGAGSVRSRAVILSLSCPSYNTPQITDAMPAAIEECCTELFLDWRGGRPGFASFGVGGRERRWTVDCGSYAFAAKLLVESCEDGETRRALVLWRMRQPAADIKSYRPER